MLKDLSEINDSLYNINRYINHDIIYFPTNSKKNVQFVYNDIFISARIINRTH